MSDPDQTEDLADLYDNAPCGYVSLSPRGQVVKVNRTLSDWLQRAEDPLLGHSIHEILTFGGKIAFETHLAPLLRLQGFVHEIALDLIDAAGETIPVIANATERRALDGKHLFTRLTMFKAVDRRTFERSLIESRIKAEAEAKSEHAALELRDQFMAVLGHDLRNPLAALRSGLNILSRADSRTEREQLIVNEMEACLSRADRLIDDVLDFARGKLGAGIPVEPKQEAQLDKVIEQVVAELRAIHPETDFRSGLSIDHPVECDADRIAQMTSNLLANAVTHGAAGDSVRLEAATDEEHFRLSVANAGPPIPEAARAQLFQPFFRGGIGKSKQGLGLGLFIVSEIAKAHHGELEVDSTKTETRFTFRMPRLIGRDST